MDAGSGELEAVEDIALSGRPAPIALNPTASFMYVARRGSCELTSYAIDGASGALSELGTIPLPSDPCYLATDRSGRYLLSAYYLAEKAAVHGIDEDGIATDPAIEWRDTGRGAHCFQTDPSNRFAFVPHIAGNGAANAIFQFRFDAATGRLSPNEPERVAPEAEDGPRHFCFHPTRDLVYVSNEQGCSVATWAFDTDTGTLAHLETLSTLPAGWSGQNTCAQIHITPDGRFLYAPNRGHDSIAEFAVDGASGRLEPLGHAAAEKVPRAFGIDPAGRFLLSAGLESGHLAVYRIDADSGRLDQIAVHEAGQAPMWVTIIRAA
jgi:6-phosphogluconolactonase